jgi:NAD(P)-dependent dehydrogenase (short-subunit alcohol dehydrogenase family)
MSFLSRNWKLLALVAGVGIAREVVQRRKWIDLQDKVVLITGSRGLAMAMAEEFAHEGAKIVLSARDEQELQRAKMHLSEFRAEVLTIPCDVSDAEQAKRCVEQATAYFGRVDVLVNDAGVISAGPLQTSTRQDFEEAIDIMFWGTYNMAMAVLPQMKERKSGRIVNITSIGGKVSVPHLLSYATAKFAAVGFSEGLHAELAPSGIVVTTVVPWLMRAGSQVNAVIRGEEHQTEYSLFTILDTLPGLSIDVQRAARQIVRATKHGTTELIIAVQAEIFARLQGLLPGLSTDLLGLTQRLLPTSNERGQERYAGRESETPLTKSPLTRLGQQAADDYNENGNK